MAHSSGELTASGIVDDGVDKHKFWGGVLRETGATNPTIVKVFDGTDNTGVLIGWLRATASATDELTLMEPVEVLSGDIYIEVSGTGTPSVAVFYN